MLVLDVALEGRRCMVMMPPKQRSHHQGLATAGQSGAFAVSALVTGRTRRRLRSQKQRRKRGSSSRKKKINHLRMHLVKLMKLPQELKLKRLLEGDNPVWGSCNLHYV
jgi:hypothetical protein